MCVNLSFTSAGPNTKQTHMTRKRKQQWTVAMIHGWFGQKTCATLPPVGLSVQFPVPNPKSSPADISTAWLDRLHSQTEPSAFTMATWILLLQIAAALPTSLSHKSLCLTCCLYLLTFNKERWLHKYQAFVTNVQETPLWSQTHQYQAPLLAASTE